MKPTTIKYRSKGVTAGPKTKNVAISPFLVPVKNTSTSPIKTAQIAGMKRKLFPDTKPTDDLSITSQSSSISSEYEQETTSSEASWSQDNKDRQFRNVMRSSTLTAVEKEPKMMLGLPNDSYHLIKLLSDNIPVPTIDILITLKKIKLNESFDILTIQFGYTQSTISRIFSKTVIGLAEKMRELIVWPKPSDIVKNLPTAFRAGYSKVSIIDCLEIEIEKPSNAVHQYLSWSQYKKCNTLKCLISCTPDGPSTTKGYGGRASDIIIVENCGYLECLPPNTSVMTDRGFKDSSHLIENEKCTLIRPPSVFKSTASTENEVKQFQTIAALRIHVERVNKQVKRISYVVASCMCTSQLSSDSR
nr:uncharacterized protein LOC111510345 [Leptinotarsa decemlineata]